MDPFHERMARVGLAAAERYGFCLAGGYAVAAHGFVERRSEDVDLFAPADAERQFPAAVEAVVAALVDDGLHAEVTLLRPTFARIQVTGDGQAAKLELGVDWRAHPPTRMSVGPVLHADDAVANKLCALFGRAEVRDYVDVDGVLRSGRYDRDELLRLAADHDPGFHPPMFAEALKAVGRLPDSAFERYGMTGGEADALRARLVEWADQILSGSGRPSRPETGSVGQV